MFKQAIQESIDHWQRMIDWTDAVVDKDKHHLESEMKGGMEEDIEETWSGGYCMLCKQVKVEAIKDNFVTPSCYICPLGILQKGYCGKEGTAYRDILQAKTWNEWIIAANKVLVDLKSLRKGE